MDLEKFSNYKRSYQIMKELNEIQGIGGWTAELTMLRGLERLEALSADYLGLRRIISRYYRYGKVLQSADAREIAKKWGCWKGLVAYYLAVADIKDIRL